MQPYEQLEAELGRWCGRPDTTVVCNSGTAALHLALEALRLPPGSEVLVPEFTFVACARAVALAGLTPVFVDCDEQLLIDQQLCREAVQRYSPAAIMPVHVYGRRCDMDEITRPYATNPGCPYIVEDLAEAHGVAPHPQTDAACWSFYRNKVIAGEEGGAVAFLNPEHAELARSLRSQGYGGGGDWQHRPRGMNYRMTNAQAELILSGYGEKNRNGLPSFAENVRQRREIERWYDEACPDGWRMPPRAVPWVYDVRVPGLDYETQTRAVKAVQSRGIAARCGFKPMSSQEEFKDCRRVGGAVEATRASREVIAFPISPGVTTPESVRACFDVLRDVVGQA